MAANEGIVLSNDPKGVFLEGTVSGTPKPGTVMQPSAGVALVNGRMQWEVFNQAADGTLALIAVLLPDYLQGKTKDDAYVTLTRCYLYCPAMGEELNMLVAVPGTGTGDNIAVADRLMVDDGTGILVADSSGASVPFIATEAVDDVAAGGTLVRVMYTGH
jgi:hypothetical protein